MIIGGGPAGLTAAYELLTRTDIVPVVIEHSDTLGGIACTVDYKGNRMDVGGHRFFSKSDRVMQWWQELLPVQGLNGREAGVLGYRGNTSRLQAIPDGPDPEHTDLVMLVRQRKSRIYFMRKLFDYPIRFSPATLKNLGIRRLARIAASYTRAHVFPIQPEKNLEHFFINRFGRELYQTFFKSYTEKVWGRPCTEISAEWGGQRIKGLSLGHTLRHVLARRLGRRANLSQKNTETSLIEQFLYPKLGVGQMWDVCGQHVLRKGGQIHLHNRVEDISTTDGQVTAVVARDLETGERRTFTGDYFFSTMPVKYLVRGMGAGVPSEIRQISAGLVYRDLIAVGLLVDRLTIGGGRGNGADPEDNWIYIHEPDVKIGRLQIFNNWSPYMVADRSKAWLGLEYFCDAGDEISRLGDNAIAELGIRELSRIGVIDRAAVIDHTVIRMPKSYPGYFGTYGRFDELRRYLDGFTNLFPIGRNGMHRYNNQDHSMLTAMLAVDNIIAGRTDKSNIWGVNTEQEYHEIKSG